ncbi:bcl-2-like protein 11 [Silurus meridionalis]|uniref:Bcl-x interacting BH3 domain-containing protein n=1 Tax=Silurus meridionalis TaxID=175797 RepID=A0A8T0BZ05_SILME|nr:bcl-2-like protein 11 [Silurus meridionalis]KAF7710976.1 hypothetical protein HF521_009848 [Silurus meridionalis]
MSRRQYPACLKEQGPCGESGSRAKAGGGGPSDPSERFRAGSLAGFQSRSPVFRLWSRSSSGYFSFDSEPSSPIITHNTATQTPSPSSQAITHFLQRISHAHNHELWPALYNHYPPHGAAPAGDMHVEFDVERHWREVAQVLRRIGDEFNQLYFHEAARNGGAAPQQAHNQPAIMLRIGLLIRRLLHFLLRRR